MANELGTIVEDLVAPSLARIIDEKLGQTVIDLMIRRRRRLPDDRVRELDALAITAETVCPNSTTATLRSLDFDNFISEISALRESFPEYDALPQVGILASLAVEDSVLRYAERHGFLVIAVGDQPMEIKNRPEFEPRRWQG